MTVTQNQRRVETSRDFRDEYGACSKAIDPERHFTSHKGRHFGKKTRSRPAGEAVNYPRHLLNIAQLRDIQRFKPRLAAGHPRGTGPAKNGNGDSRAM